MKFNFEHWWYMYGDKVMKEANRNREIGFNALKSELHTLITTTLKEIKK